MSQVAQDGLTSATGPYPLPDIPAAPTGITGVWLLNLVSLTGVVEQDSTVVLRELGSTEAIQTTRTIAGTFTFLYWDDRLDDPAGIELEVVAIVDGVESQPTQFLLTVEIVGEQLPAADTVAPAADADAVENDPVANPAEAAQVAREVEQPDNPGAPPETSTAVDEPPAPPSESEPVDVEPPLDAPVDVEPSPDAPVDVEPAPDDDDTESATTPADEVAESEPDALIEP